MAEQEPYAAIYSERFFKGCAIAIAVVVVLAFVVGIATGWLVFS